ncbi:hypothetical protein AACH06_10030 [Ideonella sp. DXS29W]|uniref:Uncharacterized protein n=1 Tax=Ideonella lacteola TaxID=2984193 RepID=A0ABU9BMH2_9BURK
MLDAPTTAELKSCRVAALVTPAIWPRPARPQPARGPRPSPAAGSVTVTYGPFDDLAPQRRTVELPSPRPTAADRHGAATAADRHGAATAACWRPPIPIPIPIVPIPIDF